MIKKTIFLCISIVALISIIGCTSKPKDTTDDFVCPSESSEILSPGVSINGKHFEDIIYAEPKEGIDINIVGSWIFDSPVISQRIYFSDGSFINILTSDGGEVYIHGGYFTTENNVVTMTDYEWDSESQSYNELTYSYQYKFEKNNEDRVLVLVRDRDEEVFKLYQNPRAKDYIGQ